MTTQNLAEDFKLLRNQVAVDKYSDQDLKAVFQKNNYDINHRVGGDGAKDGTVQGTIKTRQRVDQQ